MIVGQKKLAKKPETEKERVERLTRALSKYRLSENGEHEEGYDGHWEWRSNDKRVTQAKSMFCYAHKKHKYDIIKKFVGALVSPEDGRLQSVINLLKHRHCDESLKEALLLSISIGSRPLVELILGLYVDGQYFERTGCANSLNFPPHMTPLMLACIHNNFSIVQCLLNRGHSIQIPHFKDCLCNLCQRSTVHSRSGTRMVDIMRAISSEAFLWLATDDVYAASCAIANDLREMIREDDLEYVETFRLLEGNVQRFLARISDAAWRSEEFLMLVTSTNYCSSRNCRFSAPRLQMAFDSHMRQFACTSNVQTTMMATFWSDWRNMGNSARRDFGRILRATVFSPILCFLHIFQPVYITTCQVPAARVMAHGWSFVIFLAVAMIRLTLWDGLNSNYLELYMYLYVWGMILERAMLMHRIGPHQFFSFWWRWLDAIMIVAFLMSFISYLAKSQPFREKFNPELVDRKHWPASEPLLVHEVFLAISCTISIGKVFYYMQLIQKIGGSVISVGKCIGKVYTYIIIMLIVIFAFSIGMNIITMPYVNRSSTTSEGVVVESTTSSYETIAISTKNLFWSIFGYLGPSSYVTAVGNTGPNLDAVDHTLNSATLEILGALYHGVIIITLMNLMTSLLVKKADEVLDNEEMEYKYTRAMLYSEFLSWEMAVPPPLNLLGIFVHYILRSSGCFAESGWGKPAALSPEGEYEEEMTRFEFYENVMVKLFERFVSSKECKYKSIWRTEFKDEKLFARVAYVNQMSPPIPQDNIYHIAPSLHGFDPDYLAKQQESLKATYEWRAYHVPKIGDNNRRFELYLEAMKRKKLKVAPAAKPPVRPIGQQWTTKKGLLPAKGRQTPARAGTRRAQAASPSPYKAPSKAGDDTTTTPLKKTASETTTTTTADASTIAPPTIAR